MPRLVLSIATAAMTMITTTAMADRKSECQTGLAMIKAELTKKHPEPVIAALRSALTDAEYEVSEEDWSECTDKIKEGRAALGR